MIKLMLQNFLENIREGTVIFLGLLCVLVFVANAVLLGWLVVKKSAHGLAKCPRCGRVIACPHCQEDERESA